MAGSEKWAMERKYDGEYCEIHIDLSRGTDCIQIFSKSGKDSTEDRRAVHETILEALRIGKPNCAFRKRCIVLGELLVYSDLEQKILEFHKIRKHVSRSGVFLGTDEDSQAHAHEHLMIMFFDVLLIDDEVLMAEEYNARRNALRKLVKKRLGYAMTSEWRVVDFGHDDAMEAITYQFAAALAYRTEGLVLKPADMPYFSFDVPEDRDPRHYFIKLKKDYIAEFGQERDVADFAVVGASYDCQQALRSGIRGLQFTHFHLGCHVNPDAVRFGHQPVYEMVASIGDDRCVPKQELQALNDYGRSCCKPLERSGNRLKNPNEFDLLLDQTPASKMSVIFTEPCVVEVLGSGFEKPSNKSHFMLRHPRILKLHLDRSWKDVVSMEELQRMAEEARSAPVEGESQETVRLVEKLKGKLERKTERDRSSLTTPRTDSTVSPNSMGRKPTGHGSPISSSPSIRKKGDSSVFVRVDTAELPGKECHGAKQIKHRLQSVHASIKDPLPTLPTSSVDRSPDVPHVPATMKMATTLPTIKSSQKRMLDEPSDPQPKKRRQTGNSTSSPLPSSRPTLTRCSSCGKFKLANQSRNPLADITSKQSP
jgi:DNA ligase-4